MTKKGYQKRLPTVLPPGPRTAPEQDEAWPAAEAPAPAPPEPPPPEPPPPEPPPPVPAPPAPEVAATVTTSPETARTPRSRKATVGLIVGLVVLVADIVLLAAYLLGAFDDDAEPTTADPAPIEDVGGSSLEESFVAATVQPEGDIVVRQRILSEEPLSRLVLALPDLPESPLSASRVWVVADGERAKGSREISDGAATYQLDGATEVQLGYRMHGAVQRSDSAPGRALALVTTMEVTYSGRPAREILVVRAPEVLSLACAASTDAPLVPCGSALDPNRWQVELPAARAGQRVIAQITLPPTGQG